METKRRWAALGIAIAPLFATSPRKVTDAAFVLGRLVHLSPDFYHNQIPPTRPPICSSPLNLCFPNLSVRGKVRRVIGWKRITGYHGHHTSRMYWKTKITSKNVASEWLLDWDVTQIEVLLGIIGVYWVLTNFFLPCSSASLQPLQKPLRKQPAGASLLDECQSRRSPRSPGIGRSRVAASGGDNFVREQTAQLLS